MLRFALATLIVLSLAAVIGVLVGSGPLLPGVQYAPGGLPDSVAKEGLDCDSDAGLVAADYFKNNAPILPDDGDGTIGPQFAGAHDVGLGMSGNAAQGGGGSIVGWGSQVVGGDVSADLVAVSGGGQHSLGLKADGSIVALGWNWHGQCDVPAPNTDFVAVAAGSNHSLGLKSDGSIVAWGLNHYDQCDVPAPNTDFVAVAAGSNHGLGLKSDGSIVAWGRHYEGQCDVPAPNMDFVAVVGGGEHSLGLKTDGSIAAWGKNNRGQCDVPAPNTDFVAVAGGYYHSLGLKANGSIVAWGAGQPGQAGYPHYGQCDVPAPNADFVAVAAGDSHSLGLKTDGSIVAWGDNRKGQCNVPAPNTECMTVSGGSNHSLGLKSDGSIVAWGWNQYAQCSVPAPNTDFVALTAGHKYSLGLKADGSIVHWGFCTSQVCDVPAPNADFVAISSGYKHSLGLKADGSIVAWGLNDYGQCDVPAPNADFVAVAGARNHSLGLKTDGSIVAWGDNRKGQCDVPGPNTDFMVVAGGGNHSLGLKADSSIVAWGDNFFGQCDVPVPNTNFVAVAGGGGHSLGLKADGSIMAWGYNYYGQCDVSAPNTDFVAVAGGGYHSLGLQADGSIVAWGAGQLGQSGLPHYGQCKVSSPNRDFVAVAAGDHHSLGIKRFPQNRPPLAACQDVPVGADGNCEGTVSPGDVDNGSYDPDGDPITLTLDPPGPYPLGTTSVTLTVTDDSGASGSCAATVTVDDGPNTPPTISCPPDMTIECDESTNPSNTGTATSTDNCDPNPVISFADSVAAGPCPQASVITRTWMAADASGNSNSCPQVITVGDTTAPTLTMPAGITLECDESTNPSNTGAATATDNCDPAPAISYSDDTSGLTGCNGTGTIIRAWTATDACVNAMSLDQIITVDDTTAPGLTVPADVTIECDESTNPSNTGTAIAMDNCDPAPGITFTDTTTAGSCPQGPIITRTWTATDACSNATSLDQVIAVVDTTAPAVSCPADVTIDCTQSTDPVETGVATATDNCDPSAAVTLSDNVIVPPCPADPIQFVIERSWTATDACGNTSSCMQTITVLKRAHSGLIIKQGACPAPLNRNSHGVVPVVLPGEVGFDVTEIDLATVRLSRADCIGGSVAPTNGPPGPPIRFLDLDHPYDGVGPCSCTVNQSSDGLLDLVMKFRTDDLVTALALNALPAGAVVEVVLTGILAGGCEFTATDCVRLVPAGGGWSSKPLTVTSNVPGACVDVTPLDDTLDGGGFANFTRHYPLMTVVTLTAEPTANGRLFIGWQLDGVTVPLMYKSDTHLEVTIESARAVRAIYRTSNVPQKPPGLPPMPSARGGSTSARP